MGYGPLKLWTKSSRRPERVLDGFAWSPVPIEVLWRGPKGDGALTEYLLNVGCGVRIYCSNCGVPMCPGCGSRPSLLMTKEGPVSSCLSDDCLEVFERRLAERCAGADERETDG